MAFALRSNIGFYGNLADDCPLQGHAISFEAQEFIHIKVPINYYVLRYIFNILLGLIKFDDKTNILYSVYRVIDLWITYVG